MIVTLYRLVALLTAGGVRTSFRPFGQAGQGRVWAHRIKVPAGSEIIAGDREALRWTTPQGEVMTADADDILALARRNTAGFEAVT